MHQKGLACIAHADSLGLGIENNIQGHILIRGSIHIHMAVAGARLYDGDGAVLHHGLYESCPSPGDEHVNIPVQAHQLPGGIPAGILNHLDRVLGQAGA